MGREHSDDEIILAGLTAKQREVMDLLIEHKTSKEIARELGISPHTVDQRIQFAKEKLGANSRNEAALLYRRLVEICGPLTYENFPLAPPSMGGEVEAGTPIRLLSPIRRERLLAGAPQDAVADLAVVPKLFDGRHGTLVRLASIVAIAVFLVIFVLGGLAIFSKLSELLAPA